MAKAYLIGGAPRVGKTNLALRFVRLRPMFAVSADSIRDTLQGVLDPAEFPKLFRNRTLSSDESAIAAFFHSHPTKGVSLQNDESSVVWPSLKQLIQSQLADGQDILVEGVEILPAYLQSVTFDYRAVFLGNTSQAHSNKIAELAHTNPHDWMHRYTDNTIEGWGQLVRTFSSFIKAEADRYRMPFIETHDDNFDTALQSAEHVLLD